MVAASVDAALKQGGGGVGGVGGDRGYLSKQSSSNKCGQGCTAAVTEVVGGGGGFCEAP